MASEPDSRPVKARVSGGLEPAVVATVPRIVLDVAPAVVTVVA